MITFARIQDGIVAEALFTPPDGVPIADCFAPGLFWVDVTGVAPTPEPGWTATEAGGGWSFAAPVIPPPSPPTADEVLATRIAAGISITGNAGLVATYALDPVSTAEIFQLGLYASQFDSFPGGATQAYPDATGIPHTFTVAQFVAFLRAVAPLVSALTTQASIMAHGGTAVWPQQTANIT
jgi:hypothetical protein